MEISRELSKAKGTISSIYHSLTSSHSNNLSCHVHYCSIHNRPNGRNLKDTTMDNKNIVHICSKILFSCKGKNETMNFSGKWMKLENIFLSKINQTQKEKSLHVFSCTWFLAPNVQIRKYLKNLENQKRIMGVGGQDKKEFQKGVSRIQVL